MGIKTTKIDRMVGLEVEYRRSGEDSIVNYENEYYNGMKEINRILLPMHKGNTVATLKTVRNLLVGIDNRLGNTLGTYGWSTSYGYAFNGLHLHISHKIDKDLLTKNILRVISKWGITPRVATSWHIRAQQSYRGFKVKDKYKPVHVTPIGTTEIRILDIEYFYNDEILTDIAMAIDYSTYEIREELHFGSTKWFYQDCYNEDIGKLLNVMEKNPVDWYVKLDSMVYLNNYTGDVLDFNRNYDRNREEFTGLTKYNGIMKITDGERIKVSITDVVDIFNIEATSVSKDFMQFRLDNKNLCKLKYDLGSKCLRGKLIHVPLCMAQGTRVKVLSKIYTNIPNDVFTYLGRELTGVLDISDTETIDKFVQKKLEELFRLEENTEEVN